MLGKTWPRSQTLVQSPSWTLIICELEDVPTPLIFKWTYLHFRCEGLNLTCKLHTVQCLVHSRHSVSGTFYCLKIKCGLRFGTPDTTLTDFFPHIIQTA